MCDAASFFYLNLYIKTMLFFLEPLRLFFCRIVSLLFSLPALSHLCIILMRVVADWRTLKMEAQFPTTTGCMLERD